MSYLESIARRFNETRYDGPAADLAVTIADEANQITNGYTEAGVPDMEFKKMRQVLTVSPSDIEAAKNEDYRSTLNNNNKISEEDFVYFVEGQGKYDISNNKKEGNQQESAPKAQITQGAEQTQQTNEENIER